MYMTKRFNVLSLWPWNFMKLLEIEARIISHISYQLPMYEKLLPFSTTNKIQPCSVVSRRKQPCLPQIRSTTYVRHTTAWAPIVWHKTILGKQKLKKKEISRLWGMGTTPGPLLWVRPPRDIYSTGPSLVGATHKCITPRTTLPSLTGASLHQWMHPQQNSEVLELKP